VPLDPANDEEVVAAFAAEISPRTRFMTITHVIHFIGQVLPVDRLCALARSRGIEVLVDAAHSFAQREFSAQRLGCDYLAASLHKWLGAPLGTGVLFVRKDRIAGLRPLYGDTVAARDDVRRLEHFGNRPDSACAGIRESIRWHQAIGTAAKRERLLHLQRSWTVPLRANERYRVLSPSQSDRQTAIGAVRLEGVSAGVLGRHLMETHRIFATVLKLTDGDALRITPGLATSADEMAELLEALTRAPERLARGTREAARRLWA
jgi:selenocysteine lyase/cysteine desulfurase